MSINFDNLSKIHSNLNDYSSTKLLIVTKNQTQEDLHELLNKGYQTFGENRVQEAKQKFSPFFSQFDFDLHLIGPLQTNKVKDALTLFDTIQTIDRKKLVDEIIKVSKKIKTIKTKNYYIQINIGSESQKSGIEKNSIKDFYDYMLSYNFNIEGLMCIPPNTNDPSQFFQEMCDIRLTINPNLKLSMGMSNDYHFALKKNSNLIRIGSMVFS